MQRRVSHPGLRPFVSRVWATDGLPLHPSGIRMERVLPSGASHLVFRIGTEPLRLWGAGSGEAPTRVVGAGIVGGVRSRAYFKDVSVALPSVGAVLEPGASLALFGVEASELAGGHFPLDAFWGADAELLADELASIPRLCRRLDRFESRLLARLSDANGVHPGIAVALESGDELGVRAAALAQRAGLGPRRFAEVFRRTVGITPKRWLRLRRFQHLIERAGDPALDWSRLAVELGYSDQPHLTREFREFSGITPEQYRRLAPSATHHVPLEGPWSESDFFKTERVAEGILEMSPGSVRRVSPPGAVAQADFARRRNSVHVPDP